MFLDDELLKIGRTGHSNRCERKLEATRLSMLLACMENLGKNTYLEMVEKDLVANVKRVENTWRKIVAKLHLEGFHFISLTQFKEYMESQKEFKGLCPLIWGKENG